MCKNNTIVNTFYIGRSAFLLLLFLHALLFLNAKSAFSQFSASATYTAGHISTDRNFPSVNQSSSCPGQLTVTIPIGVVITSVSVQYTMTASGGGRIDQQRSELRCTSIGGTKESSVTSGVGSVAGTYAYNRSGLTIANNVQCGGNITFEMHAGRTSNSSDCNQAFNRVDNNSWTVTVHYIIPDNNSEISNGDLADADSISALFVSYGDRQTVFDVKLSDVGTADGKPTVIDEIAFTQGAANEFDNWSAFIAGASLYGPDLGENSGLEIYGVVTADRITFTGINIISIPNFEAETYQLRIWIRPALSSVSDNLKFQFELSGDNITTSLCTPSSSFGDFAAESSPVALFFKRDENSALTEGDEDEPSNLLVTNATFGSRIQVIDFKLIDLGSGDGAPTIIDNIVFTQGINNEIADWRDVIDGATLYGPDLGEDVGFEAFAVIDSTELRFYTPDIITIDDGAEETYRLRIWLNPSILTIYDNMAIDFELDYTNITTSSKFSSVFGIGHISSGGILLFPKNANSYVVLADSINPPIISSAANVEAERTNVFNFNIIDDNPDGFNTIINSIIFTQGDNNEIADWTSIIAGASLYGPDLGEISGAELFGTVNENNIVFGGSEIIIVDDDTLETYQLRIWLTDELSDCRLLSFKIEHTNIDIDTLGSRLDTFEIESPPITIKFEKDYEIEIMAGSTPSPTSLPSTANEFLLRETVFDFKISDLGNDRFNTIFDKIVFTQSVNNQIPDWTNLFEGASLYGPDLGEVTGSELTGTIYSSFIEFDLPSMITIPEGDTQTYQLRVWFKADLSNVNDNDAFAIKIDFEGLYTAECNSSWIDNGLVQTGPIALNIQATKIIFVYDAPPLFIEKDVEFSVTVMAVDDNNNFDADAQDLINLDINFGTGAINSGTGLQQNLINGTFTWNDITYNIVESLTLNTTSLSLAQGISDTIICLNEISEIIHGDNTEPTQISSAIFNEADRFLVFDFTFFDHGIADGIQTIINEIVITQGAENQIPDWTNAIAGATLYGPDLGEATGSEIYGLVEANRIVFADTEIITIDNGESETYMLKIWLNTDLSNINHNDKLDFKLHYRNVTVEDESTIFGKGIVESGGIKVFINPYKLVFDTIAPPKIVGYYSTFAVKVLVMDQNNNINTTDTSIVLLSKFSGIGSISSDTTGLSKKLVKGTYIWYDIRYNNLGFFRLQATAPCLITAVSDSIESLIDEDTEIAIGPTARPKKMNSVNCTYNNRQFVMDIVITDKGTFDGLPTIINQLVITQGLNNAVPDWSRAIEGATLFGPDLGEISGIEIEGAVDTNSITFNVNNMISVRDGTSEIYKLKIWLNQDLAGVIDNDSLDFKLDYTNITPKTLGSSYFGAGQANSNGIAIDIKATQLVFAKNQPPTIVGFSYNFVVSVHAVDANGNLDIDANDLVTLTLYQGTGLLTSPAPFTFTQLLSGGKYTWYETKYNKDEPFRLRVVSNTLNQGLSDVILCKKCVRSALYTLGDIDTDRSFVDISSSSNCPGQLSIFVPSFAVVTSTDVFYSMTTHATPGKKVEQRSQLRCVSPGGLNETAVYEGTGAQGTQEYRRLNLDIANYVTPGIDFEFELHAGRTNKGNACGHSFNLVLNYTWTVCINYVILGVHWTGEVNTDWFNPYNWACEIVPSKFVDVFVLADAQNFPIISSGDAETRSLFIEAGASVTIQNGRNIDVYGDMTIDGTLDIENTFGKVSFKGNGATATGKQLVTGTGNYNFYNFYIANGAYVKLLNEINVSGDLTIYGTLEATNSRPINLTGISNNFYVEGTGKFLPKLSTVHFKGKERQKIKGGTSSFYAIEINTAQKDHQLVLIDNLTISNKLKLKKGALNLNRKTLTINTSSTNAIEREDTDYGYIYPETEPVGDFASKVKWNIGTNVADYNVPFGFDTVDIIPTGIHIIKNKMGPHGYIAFSTYATTPDNQPMPNNVLHLGDTSSGNSIPDFIVDRYWYFDHYKDGKEDALARMDAFLLMSYHKTELDNVIESSMIAQRFNYVKNTWADLLYSQNDWETYSIHGFSQNFPIPEDENIGKFKTAYVDTAQLFNVWVLSDFNIFLPIKLRKFEAACHTSFVEINWITATETNNHFFTVEKSIDGTNWKEIAVVEGAHFSSSDKYYSIIDPDAYQGISFYRLKQTDFDGKSDYAPPAIVNCQNEIFSDNIMVFPNPIINQLNLSYFDIFGDNVAIELYDALGKMVYSKKLASINGEQGSFIINMDKFSDGIYFLKFVYDDNTFYEKIIKQKP